MVIGSHTRTVMTSRNSRRVALVTGAASGIGRGIALRLASDGHDVAVCDLPGSALSSVSKDIESLGRRSLEVYLDVSVEEQVRDAVDSVVNKLGSLDIVSHVYRAQE